MDNQYAGPWQFDKRLVPGLIELVTQGLMFEMVDEAEAVLAALHVLRPDMHSFDIFNSWVLIKRGRYTEAARVLRGFDASPEMGPMATALLAVCNFANGDSEWRINANEILQRNENPDAVELVSTLLARVEGQGVELPVSEQAAEKLDWMGYSGYLRA
ncbi:HrpB1 family type III secretion system apparatus protein [Uliginosibacterium gangwonense]|uniref:HrpB1 family type III secretion system apparatus protein n=1 Tax=Uliginosibacterium gangwonense TaxID=392736 RepID=UPI00035D9E36|nr:HrpB1 family type III secretion system apparatus protein [Uliginosibacterium gangwonense]